MKNETGYDAYFAGQLDLAPIVLRKYIINMIAIEGKSMDTVVSYFGDIFWLFRYLVALKGIEITYKGDILLPHTHGNNDYNEIIKAVSDVIDTDFIRSISRDDIKQFVMYMARRKVKASTRNRRLSAIRSFFEFCCNDVQIIDSSPCQTITNSKKEKKLPKYLTLEESEKLLASVKEGKNYDRNYCMLTLFLNCGLRLTELVDIDISDIQNDTLRIMGKGAKERILHLNESCMVAAKIFEGKTYPWEVLPLIKDFILELGETLDPAEYEKRGENIWIAKDASIAPTASINGPCIIGKGAEIRQCAFIRGNAIVGEGAVVGNSTELKNVILFNKVQVPHYNYVGDSVLGYKAHMGAGSITSNVKSDKKLVVVKSADEQIETGLKKFGAMLGDEVEVGW